MFRAGLIENKQYYKLRSRKLLLMLLPAIPLAFVINYYMIETWVAILMGSLYIASLWLIFKNQTKLSSILGKRSVEFDEQEIRISSKHGELMETIALDQIDRIVIKKEYALPGENMNDLNNEIRGVTQQNFIVLQKDAQERRLDFELDSYYMLEQLKKVLLAWKSNGYTCTDENGSEFNKL